METFFDGPPHSKCLENAKNVVGRSARLYDQWHMSMTYIICHFLPFATIDAFFSELIDRQAACKAQAQHSQGCNVFYKIVNCHLCWKAFPPRHLHFGRCCTLESWLTSSRNSCRSEVADILHKIQTAQWPEPCRVPALQGNGCWEGTKKTEIVSGIQFMSEQHVGN